MTPEERLERGFAALRAAQARARAPLAPERLDALLDPQADPQERRAVAAAVAADPTTRAQLALLLAADAELAAGRARARWRRLAGGALAVAAAVLLAVLWWPGSSVAPALVGQIEVVDADPPKDVGWPPVLRVRPAESLQLAGAAASVPGLTWAAVEIAGPGAFRAPGIAGGELPLSTLFAGASPPGPLLLACGRGDAAALLARLRGLVDGEVRAAVTGGAAAVARALAARRSDNADLVLAVLEFF